MRTARDYHNPNTDNEYIPFYQEVGGAVLTNLLQRESEIRAAGELYRTGYFPIDIMARCDQLEISRRMFKRYLRIFMEDRILRKRIFGKDKITYYKIDHEHLGKMVRREL